METPTWYESQERCLGKWRKERMSEINEMTKPLIIVWVLQSYRCCIC